MTSPQLEMGLEAALSGNAAAERIANVIRAAAGARPEFTSDDVAAALSPQVLALLRARPNTMGAVFRSLARAGVIERTGAWQPTTRPEGRCRLIPVWRGRAP